MVESGLVLTDLINYYERIAVRCQRIAGYLMQEGNEALKIHGHEYWFPAKDYRELYEGCRERISGRGLDYLIICAGVLTPAQFLLPVAGSLHLISEKYFCSETLRY